MLKLLLILAAAAAIAAAARSAPLEFQNLEDSDADLADVADELDLDDDLGRNDVVDERADDAESDSETDDELLSDDELEPPVNKLGSNPGKGEKRTVAAVTRFDAADRFDAAYTSSVTCPSPQTTSYPSGNVCYSCDDNYHLDNLTKICNNENQQLQLSVQIATLNVLKTIGKVSTDAKYCRFPPEVNYETDAAAMADDVARVYVLTNAQRQQVQEAVQYAVSASKNTANSLQTASDTSSVDLQTKSCGSGKVCCLQGWYGDHPNCVQCPSNKPSSPRTASGGPDSNCNCPNAAASSCFACSPSICRPFNPATGICTWVCPSCSVQRVNNQLVPKCS
jgi:hypothetical protein